MARKVAKLKSKKAKAKKPAPKKKPEAQPKGNVTPVKHLEYLAKLADTMKSRAQSASGEIGQAIKDAVESKFLNASAFRVVNRWRQICMADPIKGRSLLDAIDDYREALKIDDMKAADMMQPDKPKRERKQKTEKATGEMKPVGQNVVRLVDEMAKAIEADKASKAEQQPAEMTG